MLVFPGRVAHYVKVGRGKLYNPNHLSVTYGLHASDSFSKDPLFKWKLVNPKCFESYVSFLKTNHDSHLFVAEREL